MESDKSSPGWLDRPILHWIPPLRLETILIVFILALAVFSRLFMLDARTMSHDEVNHVTPSWRLYQGQGYQHDPVTHGPFQFHIVALSYFLFNDNDFTSRLPAALFSIGTVLFILLFYKRYLGKAGRLIAAFLVVISPFMLFYGRYTRNEAFVAFWGVMLFYGLLRYLDSGENKYLYLVTFATIMHFATKETSFIYTAQYLLFLGFFFLDRITRQTWQKPNYRAWFIVALLVGALILGAGLALERSGAATTAATPAASETTATPTATPTPFFGGSKGLSHGLVLVGFLSVMAAVYILIKGFTWTALRKERSFNLVILILTLILPQLTSFPIVFLGWNPLDYSWPGMQHTLLMLIPMVILSVVIGLLWDWQLWLGNAILFYSLFTVFFTTFFTNGQGFFTGMIGSLGYWLSQQSVQRGSQPWYYFAGLQVPFYEFLPALGALLAVYFACRRWIESYITQRMPIPAGAGEKADLAANEPAAAVKTDKAPTLAFFIFWAATSLVAYSLAGEKMPWLTVHITYPLILLAGWALGRVVEAIDWDLVRSRAGMLVLVLLPAFLVSLAIGLMSPLGMNPPFQGKEAEQLQATGQFLGIWLIALLTGAGIFYLSRGWSAAQLRRLTGLAGFILLAVLTVRSAVLANYINYDTGKEYLVYAHGARGPEDALAQITDISRRIYGTNSIEVAYDNDTLYPYWWYLRDYRNIKYFADKPNRDIRNAPVVTSGASNYGKVEPILGQNYYSFEYMRMVWPNQDYFGLTWERISNALTNRMIRNGIFQIWLNRDYALYAQATNNTALTPENWSPGDKMRIYIRKDIAAKLWQYGVGPYSETASQIQDPYLAGTIQVVPDRTLGGTGGQPGQFLSPRAVAVAPDGSLYVADSRNHRIQHVNADGQVIKTWGAFADVAKGAAPGGTFNEPWGIALGPDGSVYVADTWNHRVQKFTADGVFITMWGNLGQDNQPTSFWGPRGILVTPDGKVYVTDTGNKRVVVFDANGKYITSFGSAGVAPGQLDEPVGLAVDPVGNILVVDTWNQRVQIFTPSADGSSYLPTQSFDVSAWASDTAENKPFIAADAKGHIFVTDPDAFRVLEFDSNGTFIQAIGGDSTAASPVGMPSGIAVDAENNLWVTDAANMRLVHIIVPIK